MNRKGGGDFKKERHKDNVEWNYEVISSKHMSREQKVKMYMDSITDFGKRIFGPDDDEVDEDGCHEMTLKEFCSHELDMIENEGFDIEDYSKVSDPGMMVRFYYPPERPTNEKYRAELAECSVLAIKDYNKKMGTNYSFSTVIKANLEPLCPYRYYITFEATDAWKKNPTIFQARVNISFPSMVQEVELVQIKTEPKYMVFTRPHESSS